MKKHLAENGITKTLIYSADAIFASDPAMPDKRLAAKLKKEKMFLHIPTVNPLYKNWMDIVKERNVNAVRVYPNYHKYSLLSEANCELAEYLAANNILYIVSMRLEDERSHHPSCMVTSLKTEELIEFAKKFPKLKILCLCAYYGEFELLLKLSQNIFADISFAETNCTIEKISKYFPSDRIIFGSHTPFFYTAANVNKLKYANINSDVYEKIAENNAIGLLPELKQEIM